MDFKEALAQRARGKAQEQRKSDRAQRDDLPADEQKTLKKLQREAQENGATLASGGKGGLPPSLALHVFRRDKWECKACGSKEDLTLHHKGGIPASKWLSKQGHSNNPNNIVTLCPSCHDKMHQEARREGDDSSQVTPAGDEGDPRRDKGLPPAHPSR
jgi:hypothetical protein